METKIIENGQYPAMPVDSEATVSCAGFTKFEQMTIQFMAAKLIHHGVKDSYGWSDQQAALESCEMAEALLAEWSKRK